MSQSTAGKPTGQKAARLSTPVTVAADQTPTDGEKQIIELLGRIYTELRVMNRMLQMGMNISDDPGTLRNDPEFLP